MLQNLIALFIVFLTSMYTIFAVYKNLSAKKTTPCGGCSGCSLKGQPFVKHTKTM
jgi:hypothetical protein